MSVQFDATARKWHVISGGNLVSVLFSAETEAECEAWLRQAEVAR
jgi:hypothetical protein